MPLLKKSCIATHNHYYSGLLDKRFAKKILVVWDQGYNPKFWVSSYFHIYGSLVRLGYSRVKECHAELPQSYCENTKKLRILPLIPVFYIEMIELSGIKGMYSYQLRY